MKLNKCRGCLLQKILYGTKYLMNSYWLTLKTQEQISDFGGIWCVFGRTVQNFRLFFLLKTDPKSLSRYGGKLQQWNKQTVVENYCLVLHNNHKIMSWIQKDLNDFNVFVIFKANWALAQLFKLDNIYISIISIKLLMESF